MSSCVTSNVCDQGLECIDGTCQKPASKLPIWLWVVIGVGAVVLIAVVAATFYSCKKKNRKNIKTLKREKDGPAPLPAGYMKPVDLLQVAEVNRREHAKRQSIYSVVTPYDSISQVGTSANEQSPQFVRNSMPQLQYHQNGINNRHSMMPISNGEIRPAHTIGNSNGNFNNRFSMFADHTYGAEMNQNIQYGQYQLNNWSGQERPRVGQASIIPLDRMQSRDSLEYQGVNHYGPSIGMQRTYSDPLNFPPQPMNYRNSAFSSAGSGSNEYINGNNQVEVQSRIQEISGEQFENSVAQAPIMPIGNSPIEENLNSVMSKMESQKRIPQPEASNPPVPSTLQVLDNSERLVSESSNGPILKNDKSDVVQEQSKVPPQVSDNSKGVVSSNGPILKNENSVISPDQTKVQGQSMKQTELKPEATNRPVPPTPQVLDNSNRLVIESSNGPISKIDDSAIPQVQAKVEEQSMKQTDPTPEASSNRPVPPAPQVLNNSNRLVTESSNGPVLKVDNSIVAQGQSMKQSDFKPPSMIQIPPINQNIFSSMLGTQNDGRIFSPTSPSRTTPLINLGNPNVSPRNSFNSERSENHTVFSPVDNTPPPSLKDVTIPELALSNENFSELFQQSRIESQEKTNHLQGSIELETKAEEPKIEETKTERPRKGGRPLPSHMKFS